MARGTLLEHRLALFNIGGHAAHARGEGCYDENRDNEPRTSNHRTSNPEPPHVINPGRLRNFVLIASAVQYASAATGPVGLYAELCGNAFAPSTKTFGTSHDCRYLLTALLPGELPMIAPPVLCVD